MEFKCQVIWSVCDVWLNPLSHSLGKWYQHPYCQGSHYLLRKYIQSTENTEYNTLTPDMSSWTSIYLSCHLSPWRNIDVIWNDLSFIQQAIYHKFPKLYPMAQGTLSILTLQHQTFTWLLNFSFWMLDLADKRHHTQMKAWWSHHGICVYI